MSGKQKSIDDKEETTAPGAAGSSENTAGLEFKDGILVTAEPPKWVEDILSSNELVIASNAEVVKSNESLSKSLAELIESAPDLLESNKSVIDALSELKDRASRTVGNYQEQMSKDVPAFDHDADYEVAEGKSFRDPKDFKKEYTEGDNVSHLGAAVLENLLNQGLIIES